MGPRSRFTFRGGGARRGRGSDRTRFAAFGLAVSAQILGSFATRRADFAPFGGLFRRRVDDALRSDRRAVVAGSLPQGLSGRQSRTGRTRPADVGGGGARFFEPPLPAGRGGPRPHPARSRRRATDLSRTDPGRGRT